MKRQLRNAWVRALRSGEYKQAQTALCILDDPTDASTVGYCCLGVLCDIAVDGEWVLPDNDDRYTLHVDGDDDDDRHYEPAPSYDPPADTGSGDWGSSSDSSGSDFGGGGDWGGGGGDSGGGGGGDW